MKKIFLSMTILLMAGSSVMAQSAQDKEAAKAAKAAEKAAKKEAKTQFNQALSIKNALELKVNEKKATDDELKTENTKIKDLILKSLNSGNLDESRYAEAWKMASGACLQLNNLFIADVTNSLPIDTVQFFTNVKDLTTSLKNELKYTKVTKGETGNENYIEGRKKNLAQSGDYYIYAAQLLGESKRYDNALEAFSLAMSFKEDYPEVASMIESRFDNSQLAYYAFHMAHDAKKYDAMEKYHDTAMQYADGAKVTEQVYQQSFLERGDTATWAAKIHDMCLKAPQDNTENIQMLLGFYQKKGLDKMSDFADEVLAVDDKVLIALYAKAFVLFNSEKYDEALTQYQKCTEVKPDYYDAWYQSGLCKYRQALALNATISGIKNQKEAKAAKDKTIALFSEAIPYFEKARECAPDEPSKWAYELKQCYTVSGNAAKAAEMDKLL